MLLINNRIKVGIIGVATVLVAPSAVAAIAKIGSVQDHSNRGSTRISAATVLDRQDEFVHIHKQADAERPRHISTKQSSALTAHDYYLSGLQSLNQQEYQKAIANFEKAIAINPDFAEAYFFLGNVRLESGDHAGAIADFEQLIAIKPEDAYAYYFRGHARYKSGDKVGALADFDQAIAIDPNDDLAYLTRGLARDESGDKIGAIADYDKAIAIDPDFADAYSRRGRARSDLGDKTGAIADLEKAATLFQQRGNQVGYDDVIDVLESLREFHQNMTMI